MENNINLIENEIQNYMIKTKEVETEKVINKRKEYLQIWNLENKDKVIEAQNKFKEQNPNYWKEYYKSHKEDIKRNTERWVEEHKGMFVYFHISKNSEILYIGKTENLEIRQSAHLTANSHLKMDIEQYIEKYDFCTILYKDFTKYNLNDEDLSFLENWHKENYEEIIKGRNVKYKEELLSKSPEELISLCKLEQMVLFNLDKYFK